MTRRPNPFPRLRRALRRLGMSEEGSATLEFVLIFPAFVLIFVSAFESGLLTLRYVMLERAVDISVRNLRLGLWEDPDHDMLRDEICAQSVVIGNCQSVLLVELIPVDPNTWDLPSANAPCVDRDEELQPVTDFVVGKQNEMMLVRACAIFDPIFPTSALALQLAVDSSGGYAVSAASSFVNEPS